MALKKNGKAPSMRRRPAWLLLLLLAGPVCLTTPTRLLALSSAEPSAEEIDATTSLAEEPLALPSIPKPGDLLPFEDTGASTQRFAVDKNSITLGKDKIVRYTLVSTSSAGAQNISYEGIRCQTFERKIYASGRADGTWSLARDSHWVPISIVGLNRQRASLAQDYFCDNATIAGNAADMRNRLERKASLKSELTR